jgi:hypothetical protein
VTLINADHVIDAIALRHSEEQRSGAVQAVRAVWMSIAEHLDPEEQVAILFALSPLTVAVGSPGYRVALARVASAAYPSMAPAAAASRFRTVLRRKGVRSVLAEMRAEESIHALASRAQVRSIAFDLARAAPVPEWEPKDQIAHNRMRLTALAQLVALDDLAARPAPDDDREGSERVADPRKNLVDRLAKLVHR